MSWVFSLQRRWGEKLLFSPSLQVIVRQYRERQRSVHCSPELAQAANRELEEPGEVTSTRKEGREPPKVHITICVSTLTYSRLITDNNTLHAQYARIRTDTLASSGRPRDRNPGHSFPVLRPCFIVIFFFGRPVTPSKPLSVLNSKYSASPVQHTPALHNYHLGQGKPRGTLQWD